MPGHNSSSSAPPSYSPAALAQPFPRPQLPTFRQRKSSTIISFSVEEPPSPTISLSSLPGDSGDNNGGADPKSESEDSHPAYAMPRASAVKFLPTLERRVSNSSAASASAAEEGEATPLLAENSANSGRWYEGPVFVTGVKLSLLFLVFTGIVVGTFWFGMPKVDPEDRPVLKIPKSFADLQALNALFQKYKHRYPLRILACGVVSYLFVQTFSLPGSMYISILFGAAYGIMTGLLLSCLCDSVGSIFCYTLSSLLAPPLLALPYYRARVEMWRKKIMGDPDKGKQVGLDGVFAFLVVLRIAPFPPHWVANFVAPHLGISMGLFWLTCFIGIAPVSVIHVTIGSSLDTMTSADDFHIVSVRNVLGLCAVVVAVLIPVGLKRVFRKDLGDLGEAEAAFENTQTIDGSRDESETVVAVPVLAVSVPVEYDEHGLPKRFQAVDSGVVLAGPSSGDPALDLNSTGNVTVNGKVKVKGKGRQLEIIADVPEEGAEDDDDSNGLGMVTLAKSRKGEKSRPAVIGAFQPLRGGYGAIEPVARETRPEQSIPWWRFSGRSAGVA